MSCLPPGLAKLVFDESVSVVLVVGWILFTARCSCRICIRRRRRLSSSQTHAWPTKFAVTQDGSLSSLRMLHSRLRKLIPGLTFRHPKRETLHRMHTDATSWGQLTWLKNCSVQLGKKHIRPSASFVATTTAAILRCERLEISAEDRLIQTRV